MASYQFTRLCELASSCQSPVSNLHASTSCQLPIHKIKSIGIWLPFAGFLLCVGVLNALISNCIWLPVTDSQGFTHWHAIWLQFACCLINWNALKTSRVELASSCQLLIRYNLRIGSYLPFASCLFSYSALNTSQIKLAFGCQMSVAKSPGYAI